MRAPPAFRWCTSRPITCLMAARTVRTWKPIRCVRSAPMAAAKRQERKRSAQSLEASRHSAHRMGVQRVRPQFSQDDASPRRDPRRIAHRCRSARQSRPRRGESRRRFCNSRLRCIARSDARRARIISPPTGFTTWHGFASRAVAVAAPITGRNPRVIPIETVRLSHAGEAAGQFAARLPLVRPKIRLPAAPLDRGVDATTRTLVAAACNRRASHVA